MKICGIRIGFCRSESEVDERPAARLVFRSDGPNGRSFEAREEGDLSGVGNEEIIRRAKNALKESRLIMERLRALRQTTDSVGHPRAPIIFSRHEIDKFVPRTPSHRYPLRSLSQNKENSTSRASTRARAVSTPK